MTLTISAAALALAAALAATAAQADDPRDPAMRDPAARAADRAAIARLNADQLAFVQQRDAGYAAGWQAYRATPSPERDADTAYADARATYAQQLAAWRQQVAACRAGDWSACQR